MDNRTKHLYEFGPFQLDIAERLLLLDGNPIPLEPKAFETLIVLVVNSGHLVEKNDLMKAVWPDSFVEESNLTRNISILRKALGQASPGHQYIETVPKQGYRFIANVKQIKDETAELIVQERARSTVIIEEEVEIGREDEGEIELPDTDTNSLTAFKKSLPAADTPARPVFSSRFFRPAALLVTAIIVATATWFVVYRLMPKRLEPPLRMTPLTSFPGLKSSPAFSPDGNQIAFAWNGEKLGDFDIYVKLINAGTPLRLTTYSGDDLSPAWSPDGSHIAFLRRSKQNMAIYLVPSLGGPERRLADVHPDTFFSSGLAWSPDKRHLAVADKSSGSEPRSIFLISVESGEKQRLTSPPAQHLGDSMPKFSPDGKSIAFVRGTSMFVNDIYLAPVEGGEARRLTFDNRWLFGLAWTAGGQEIIFSSNRGGIFSLWRISISGGTPQPLSTAGEDAMFPSISRQGNLLAYVRWKIDSNIWRVGGPHSTPQDGAPIKLIASTREDCLPQYSPDGKRIVFQSNRSGSDEIWVCDNEGLNPLQLTFLGGPQTGTPRWSPDGQRIAFDCRPEGHADIFVISAEGGSPRRVTAAPSEDNVPSWSRDGRWIYFASNRTGAVQVWKAPVEGGDAVQLTKQGGFEAFEAPDGRFVYYHKDGEIWRVPVEGGDEVRILGDVQWGCWAVLEEGICYINRKEAPRPTIELFSFATGQVRQIATIDNEPSVQLPPGFAVSPDGRYFIYKRVDQIDNDIMLVENFR